MIRRFDYFGTRNEVIRTGPEVMNHDRWVKIDQPSPDSVSQSAPSETFVRNSNWSD